MSLSNSIIAVHQGKFLAQRPRKILPKSFRRGRGKVNVVRDTLKKEKPATSLDDRFSQLLKNAARSTNRPGRGGRGGNGRRGGAAGGQRGGRRGNNQGGRQPSNRRRY